MSKESITPDRKAVPSSGGVKEGGHSHLTTPRNKSEGDVPWGKESKESIMK